MIDTSIIKDAVILHKNGGKSYIKAALTPSLPEMPLLGSYNKGQYVKQKFSIKEVAKWKYEQIRWFLFSKNLVFKKIIVKLRKKLKIPTTGFSSPKEASKWLEEIKKQHYEEVYKQYLSKYNSPKTEDEKLAVIAEIDEHLESKFFLTPVYKTSSKFQISSLFVTSFLFYNGFPPYYLPIENVRFLKFPTIPIKEKGIYIKITPDLGQGDLLKQFRGLKKHFAQFSRNLYDDYKTHRKQKGEKTVEEIAWYVRTQKYIGKIYNDKNILKQKYKGKIPKYEDRAEMVEQIVGFAVDDTAADFFNLDEIKEEKINKETERAKRAFFRTIERYRLPKFRELSSLLLFVDKISPST